MVEKNKFVKIGKQFLRKFLFCMRLKSNVQKREWKFPFYHSKMLPCKEVSGFSHKCRQLLQKETASKNFKLKIVCLHGKGMP